MALDALEEADSTFRQSGMLSVERRGGVDDGSKVRRAVQMGVVKVSEMMLSFDVELLLFVVFAGFGLKDAWLTNVLFAYLRTTFENRKSIIIYCETLMILVKINDKLTILARVNDF